LKTKSSGIGLTPGGSLTSDLFANGVTNMEINSRHGARTQLGLALTAVALLATACDNKTPPAARASRPENVLRTGIPRMASASSTPAQDETSADHAFFVLGNSHIGTGAPFSQLCELIAHRPEAPRITHQLTGCAFLDDFASSIDDIRKQAAVPNGYLVLQAQKYSQSGRYDYPIDVAVELARMGRAEGHRVLMFPEWGQRGNPAESRRVNRLHERIRDLANEDPPENTLPVDVVPVGLVWDRILEANPDWILHAADGNHSSDLGATATALAFYCWLFDEVPEGPDSIDHQEQFVEISRLALEVCREYRAAGCVTPE
jgi:hypothetical protein